MEKELAEVEQGGEGQGVKLFCFWVNTVGSDRTEKFDMFVYFCQ